ncbi:hypothetical protein MNBD_DELTA03-866 [hydrothermal vent metagenome]|uniref:Isoprenylcysteine carboxylmethyltransferase family protein n=1 Tax=hydrothermal vent metagenome TaxID=652676 RepID=A0A3B0V6G9_9ZZZZ
MRVYVKPKCLIIQLNSLKNVTIKQGAHETLTFQASRLIMPLQQTMLFVIIQFICIGLILIPFGPINHPYGLLASLPGLILAWAAIRQIRKMGPGRFNIRPTPKENSVLVTNGIYHYIRHPMYSSVLLSMLGPVLMYWHTTNTIIYAVLLINLLAKLHYEERLWLQRDPRYRNYCRQTKRLIPFIY